MLNKKLKFDSKKSETEVKELVKKITQEELEKVQENTEPETIEEKWQKLKNSKDKNKISTFFRNLTEEWIESSDKEVLEEIFDVIEPIYLIKNPITAKERQNLYKVQEKLYGALDKGVQEKLERLGKTLVTQEEKRLRQIKYNLPSNGTIITKEWRDKKLEVKIVKGGFEYEGKFYKSSSLLAREITGYHCSGPIFFGLRKKKYSVDKNGEYKE